MTQPLVTKTGQIKPSFRTAVMRSPSLKQAWNKGGQFSLADARQHEAKEVDTAWQWSAWLYLA